MLVESARRAVTAPSLALALALVLAAPATAATKSREVRYAVEYAAWGSYAFHEHRAADGTTADERLDLELTASGEIGAVTFRNGAPLDVGLADRTEGLVGGEFGGWYQFEDGSSLQAECTATPGVDAAMGMTTFGEVDGLLVALDGDVDLVLRPFDRLDIALDCDRRGLAAISLSNAAPLGEGPFDLRFELPRDVVGKGYVEQLIPERTITGERCPGPRQGGDATCTLRWQGRVKLRRLGARRAPAKGRAPHPSAPTGPVAPSRPAGSGAGGPVLHGAAAKRARLAPSGRTVAVRVGCRVACTGAVVVEPGAQRVFSLRGGRSRRVVVRLDGATRQAVRRAGVATVHVAAVAGDRTDTRTLRVRAARR